MADIPLVIRDLLGVNRRDGGERASDREFYAIQNFYRKEKGELTKKPGSSWDLQASDIPGCERILKVIRHASQISPRSVLYYCTPDTTALPSPGSGGLTLAEVTSATGTIFNAANPASRQLRFAHTYVGLGVESAWDTRARTGFVAWSGSAIDSWDQPGLQSITLASATNTVQVSHPTTFPAGVRSVNVFMAMGNSGDSSGERRNLVYVGTLYSSSDILEIDCSIGPSASHDDAFAPDSLKVEAGLTSDGSLEPGQYMVALAWVADRGARYEDTLFAGQAYTYLSEAKAVFVSPNQNSISLAFGTASSESTDGASHCYVFIGSRDRAELPMTCVGIYRPAATTTPVLGTDRTFVINALPNNSNAQSCQFGGGAFDNSCRMFTNEWKLRTGFIIKKDLASGEVRELFHSRTEFVMDGFPDPYPYICFIRTENDRVVNGTAPVSDFSPVRLFPPSACAGSGLAFFVNGFNFLVTDGLSLGKVYKKTGCAIPDYLRFIFNFKNQLVGVSAVNENLAYGSNALEFNNWSEGGTGDDLKFIVIGDNFDGRVTAAGVFASTTGINDLRSYLVFFKKSSTHMYSNIPDKASGINAQADQSSGRAGCIAVDSIVQTLSGLVFLGSDGDIYIIRGAGEPVPIGGRVKPLFAHLVANEALMKKVSAVYHKNYVKISYPSSADSTMNDAEIWGDFRTEEGVPIAWDGPHVGLNIGQQIVLMGEGDGEQRIGALMDQPGSALLDDEGADDELGEPIISVLEWNRRKLKAELNWKRFMGMAVDGSWYTGEDHTLLFEMWSGKEYTQKSVTVSEADPDVAETVFDTIISFIGDDNLVGRDFKFRITHTGGKNFTLSAVGLTYKPERRIIT